MQEEVSSASNSVSSLTQQVHVGTEQMKQLTQQLEERTTQLLESSHHAQGLTSQLEDLFKQKVPERCRCSSLLNELVRSIYLKTLRQFKNDIYMWYIGSSKNTTVLPLGRGGARILWDGDGTANTTQAGTCWVPEHRTSQGKSFSASSEWIYFIKY